jgi:hypothetical protein
MPAPTGVCHKCSAGIYWLRSVPTEKTPEPKLAPIDIKPNARGNLVISRELGLYRKATGNEREMARINGKNLYISHFVTCPHAREFRKKKTTEKKERTKLWDE